MNSTYVYYRDLAAVGSAQETCVVFNGNLLVYNNNTSTEFQRCLVKVIHVPCSKRGLYISTTALYLNTIIRKRVAILDIFRRFSSVLTQVLNREKYNNGFLCLWFRASLICINNCPTTCNTKKSVCYSASSLYMFRVSTWPKLAWSRWK